MRGARLPARIPRRLPRLLLALGAVGGGILVAGLGIGQRYSQGLQEDLAQLSARMAEAQAQQRQLLGDLQAAQSRLEVQEALLSRERMELLARQGAVEAHSRELGESFDERGAAVWGMAGEQGP